MQSHRRKYEALMGGTARRRKKLALIVALNKVTNTVKNDIRF